MVISCYFDVFASIK